jgi:hypothetical protein
MMGRRFGITVQALLACALCAGNGAAQGIRPDRLGRGRDRLAADSAALASIAQDIERDVARSARIYLTLGTVELPRNAPVASVTGAGLLEVRTEARADAVRVFVVAPSIGAYGLEQREDGVALGLEAAPAVAAAAGAAPATQQGEPLPEDAPAASVQPNAGAAPAELARGGVQDERVDVRSGARAILARMQQIALRAADAGRTTEAQRWQWIGLIACLLLRSLAPQAPARARASPGAEPRALRLPRASAG